MQYANIDRQKGLFWPYERSGLVERIVDNQQIEHFVSNPPEDTRAYGRSMVLRAAQPSEVAAIGWDSITFRNLDAIAHGGKRTRQLSLADPEGFTKAVLGDLSKPGISLEEILDLPAFVPFHEKEHKHEISYT
ncbi:MAG: proteasome accessory factor PafA2 family protein [Acidobacteria bacterium]|nr:proteasome accessory factor PafA2 family protein [Acidobacteriota bacterium]